MHDERWPVRFADLDVLAHVNNAAQWVAVEEALDRAGCVREPVRAELEHGPGVERGTDVRLRWRAVDGGIDTWLTTDGVAGSVARVRPRSLTEALRGSTSGGRLGEAEPQEAVVVATGIGLAGDAEMLEVGVGLTGGHLAPGAFLEQHLHPGVDRGVGDVGGGIAEQLEPVVVVFADVAAAARRGRRRDDRGPGRAQVESLERSDLVRANAKNVASGSSTSVEPAMCGVIVGSTWSPASSTPSSGSKRQR